MATITRRAWLGALPAAAVAAPTRGKGICSTALPASMPLDECFARAAKAGFSGMELRLGDQVGPETPDAELQRVRRSARAQGIRIESVWVSSRALPRGLLNHVDAAVRAEAVAVIRKSLRVAAALDCECVLLNVVRVGLGAKFMAGYAETWERYTAGLRECLHKAAEERVILTPENVLNKFLMSPLEAVRFVDQFASPWLKFHFDVGNAMAAGGYPQDWIRILGSRIVRVHAKDVKLNPTGFTIVDLLQGDVDWRAVMAALGEAGYRGVLTSEPDYREDFQTALNTNSAALGSILAGDFR